MSVRISNGSWSALSRPASVASPGSSQPAGDTIVVATTIQAAVDAADPGDTVLVPAGTYAETVNVTEPGITIRGSHGAVLDGSGLGLQYGIRVRSLDGSRLDGFTLDGLTIRGYSRYGSQVSGVDNFRLTGTRYLDNPLYGLFPVRCTRGRVDHNYVVGVLRLRRLRRPVQRRPRRPQRGARQHHRARGRALHPDRGRGQRLHRQRDRRTGADLPAAPGQGHPGRARAPQRPVGQQPAQHDHRGILWASCPAASGSPTWPATTCGSSTTWSPATAAPGSGVVSLPAEILAIDAALDPAPDGGEVRDNVARGNGHDPDPRLAPLPGADVVWDLTGSPCFAVPEHRAPSRPPCRRCA